MALLHCDFYSHTLKLSTSMTVILPLWGPVTQASPPKERQPYQVLWLLHGLSDDHTIWQRRTSIERYVEALGSRWSCRRWPAALHGYGLRPAVLDLRQRGIAGHRPLALPTLEAREDNFVAGLSMGGYGAFKLALRHPERFAAAASLSGALDMAARPGVTAREGKERRWVFGNLNSCPAATTTCWPWRTRWPQPAAPNPSSTSGAAPRTRSTPTTWPSATTPKRRAWT